MKFNITLSTIKHEPIATVNVDSINELREVTIDQIKKLENQKLVYVQLAPIVGDDFVYGPTEARNVSAREKIGRYAQIGTTESYTDQISESVDELIENTLDLLDFAVRRVCALNPQLDDILKKPHLNLEEIEDLYQKSKTSNKNS